MRCTPVVSPGRRVAPLLAAAVLASGLPGAAQARGPGGAGVGIAAGGLGGVGVGGFRGGAVGIGGFGGPVGFGGGFVPRFVPVVPFGAARPFGASPLVPPLFETRPSGFAQPGAFGFGSGFVAPFGFAPPSSFGFGFGPPGTLGFGTPVGTFGFGTSASTFGFGSGFGRSAGEFGTTILVPRGSVVVPGVGGAFTVVPPRVGGATVASDRAARAPLPVRSPTVASAPLPAQVWRRDNGVWHLATAPVPAAAWRFGEDGRWHPAAVR